MLRLVRTTTTFEFPTIIQTDLGYLSRFPPKQFSSKPKDIPLQRFCTKKKWKKPLFHQAACWFCFSQTLNFILVLKEQN